MEKKIYAIIISGLGFKLRQFLGRVLGQARGHSAAAVV